MKINFIFVFIAALTLLGCGKNKQQTNYAARVNDAYLGKDELTEMTDTSRGYNFYTNEFIRKWVHRELLYQEAVSEGIVDDEKYSRLLENAKKELAAALLLQKKFEEEKIPYEEKDLLAYFDSKKENFKLLYDSYLINIINFNDEDKAIQFRNTVVESDWAKTFNVFAGNPSIIENKTDVLLTEQDLHPVALQRVVKELHTMEVSIVLNSRPGEYTLVQLLEEYNTNSVPPFAVIKRQIAEEYMAVKKEKFVEEFIRGLYSQNEIEVKN
ncbi:MAG: hypothetical protein K8H86_03045 [Ignavibacteriaceae bacterium]|nr:hypothetical protein [Ignavibacteriaceae bacterium]